MVENVATYRTTDQNEHLIPLDREIREALQTSVHHFLHAVLCNGRLLKDSIFLFHWENHAVVKSLGEFVDFHLTKHGLRMASIVHWSKRSGQRIVVVFQILS